MNVHEYLEKLAAVTREDLIRSKRGMLRSGMLRTSGTGQDVRPRTVADVHTKRYAKKQFPTLGDNSWKRINPTEGKDRIYERSPQGLLEYQKTKQQRSAAKEGVTLGDTRKPKVVMPRDIPSMTKGMSKADKEMFMLTVGEHEKTEAKTLRRPKKFGDSSFSSHAGFGPVRRDINSANAMANSSVSKAIKKARRGDINKLKAMFPDLSDELESKFRGEGKYNRHFERKIDKRLSEYNAAGKKLRNRDLLKTTVKSSLGETSAAKTLKRLLRR